MVKKAKNPVCALTRLGHKKNQKQPYSNFPSSQRARIISWFHQNGFRLTTTDARQQLGIMSIAARILELRRMGHRIILNWTAQYDTNGVIHRAGEYVYMGCKEKSV